MISSQDNRISIQQKFYEIQGIFCLGARIEFSNQKSRKIIQCRILIDPWGDFDRTELDAFACQLVLIPFMLLFPLWPL
jgi:predicted ester cyclase